MNLQLINASIQLFIAILFAVSCLYKLQDFDRFCNIVGSYFRGTFLADSRSVRVLALVVIVWELAIIAAVVTVQRPATIGLLACSLLLVYAVGMGVNIARGNRLLDCGCSWGEQIPVNSWLVVRNLVLAAIVGLLFLPTSDHVWSAFAVMNVLALSLSAYVIYVVVDLIILNQSLLQEK